MSPCDLTRFNPEDLDSNISYSDRGSLSVHLRSLYGEETLKIVRRFSNMRLKRSRSLASLAFLKRCRDNNIVPVCAKVNFRNNSRRVQKILHKTSLQILRSEIEETRSRLHWINNQLYNLHFRLLSLLSTKDWDDIDRISYIYSEKVLSQATEKHIKKFNKLTTSKPTVAELPTEKTVINLTNKELDHPTVTALKKGLNFAIAPSRIPVEKIISSLECAILHLPTEKAEEIRQEVSCIIRKSTPPTPNITKDELKALKILKEDPEITVLSADKGNATVVMKTEDYKSKMYELLTEDTYKKIRNPTKRINDNIKKLISSSSIPQDMHRQLIISDPTPPILYGLPKIHKDGIPMRPIVSAIGSPTYKIAKHISNILSQHVGNTSTFIKDSRHFIKLIKDIQLQENDLLVSFDVKSLFTQVPVPETIEIIKAILPPDLTEIAAACLQSTYFYFDGNFYEQLDGAAMGSPLSPVVANLYMEHFEATALSSAQLKPKVFYRYVDDTFAVWPHGIGTLDSFLQHLNSIHPKIQFTMETEYNRQLPFLDVLVIRKENGTLGHTVYRKPTHTNRYLHATSHHHPVQKSAVLNTLANRAWTISDKEHFTTEKQHLVKTLQQNGYYKNHIIQAVNRQKKPKVIHADKIQSRLKERKAFLPYIQGTTDKIGRFLKKYDIKTVFRPLCKIKQKIRPLKDKIPLSCSGVYHVTCSCGKCYVGETGRLISTRMKEHLRLTKNLDTNISAIATHSTTTNHAIEFDKVTILANSNNYYERKFLEAIEIRKHKNNFNRDTGLELSPTWIPAIKKLTPDCTQNSTTKERESENLPEPAHSRPENIPERNLLATGGPYNLRSRTAASVTDVSYPP